MNSITGSSKKVTCWSGLNKKEDNNYELGNEEQDFKDNKAKNRTLRHAGG
jgi:hypothetical protein